MFSLIQRADFTGHQQLQHAAYAHTLKALADLDVVVALAALQSLVSVSRLHSVL